jgi:hypothetical protein
MSIFANIIYKDMTNYKTLLTIRSFNEQLQKGVEGAEDILPLVQLKKMVKKMNDKYEEFDDLVEDLRLDNCYKEGGKIVRDDKGNYQWTAEGEKAFRKGYKEGTINGQRREKRLSVKATKSSLLRKFNCLPISSPSTTTNLAWLFLLTS